MKEPQRPMPGPGRHGRARPYLDPIEAGPSSRADTPATRDPSPAERLRDGARRVGMFMAAIFAASIIAVSIGAASARAMPPAVPERPNLVLEGPATVSDMSLDLECRGSERFTCDVLLQLELVAGASGARLYVPDETNDPMFHQSQPRVGVVGVTRIRMDGREVGTDVTVPAHQRASLEVRYATSPVPIHAVGPGPPSMGPDWEQPVDARHPLLGEGWRYAPARARPHLLLMDPSDISLEGLGRLDARLPPDVQLRVNGERVTAGPRELTELSLDIRAEASSGPPPLVHGGPVLTLGGSVPLDREPARFILGVGYELGFAEHFLLSLWFETDFASIREALLVEVATPALIFIPSVAAGVGVVSTQLGNRDADVGLRLRATAAFYVIGIVADFDYFFLSGGWQVALAGRLSL